MSQTDTVAGFSLIFARKIHFSENSSEFLSKTGRSLSGVVEDHDAVRCAWNGECTGQHQVSAWCACTWCAAVL